VVRKDFHFHPGPPESLADKPSVNLSAGQVTIVWRSPPYDGGRTVIGYTVEAKRAGESTWTVIAESCHSLSHTVPTETNSVIPGESYRFRIRAENIHGLSDPGMESEPVRIPKQGETMFNEKEEEGDYLNIMYYSFKNVFKNAFKKI
jgi:myosin-light-chain kinase